MTRQLDKGQAADAKLWMAPSPTGDVQSPWQQADPAHVLVVEDDASLRDLLVTVLTRQGFQIRAVETAREGLLAIAEHPVQVLVTDYQLPDMDGVSLLEQVTRHDSRTVGILITGHGTVELAVKAMKAGAADMITKPFKPNDVVMAIQRVVEMQHLRVENRVLKQAVLRGMPVNPYQMGDLAAPRPSAESAGASGRGPSLDYLRGLAEGERQARERLAVLARQEAAVAAIGRQLAQTCTGLSERVEAQVVTLAFDIARKVIAACAEEKRDLVVAQTKEALARIQNGQAVRILVHPTDLPLLESAREQLAASFDGPVFMKMEADATVAPGGCRVQTPTQLVDATVDGQLARIAERLRQVGAQDAR